MNKKQKNKKKQKKKNKMKQRKKDTKKSNNNDCGSGEGSLVHERARRVIFIVNIRY
jgi:hypothetical protein